MFVACEAFSRAPERTRARPTKPTKGNTVKLRRLLALGGLLASIATGVAAAAPAAQADCPEFWACMNTGTSFSGTGGKVQQSNPSWSALSGPCSPGWNDCANSVINEFTNTGHNIYYYQNNHCSSGGGMAPVGVGPNGGVVDNLANTNEGNYSNQISSDWEGYGGGGSC